MRLRDLQKINEQRAKRWHTKGGGLDEWSELEWAGAMAGEAGEACNVAKKLKRIQDQIANHDSRGLTSPIVYEQAIEYRNQLAREIADTIIYGVLLMSKIGRDAEDTVQAVFNKKSEEYGFPERL